MLKSLHYLHKFNRYDCHCRLRLRSGDFTLTVRYYFCLYRPTEALVYFKFHQLPRHYTSMDLISPDNNESSTLLLSIGLGILSTSFSFLHFLSTHMLRSLMFVEWNQIIKYQLFNNVHCGQNIVLISMRSTIAWSCSISTGVKHEQCLCVGVNCLLVLRKSLSIIISKLLK